LVIACPCALVISTPVTVVSGLAAGARRGILIKGGVYLEDARKIKAVALDKTGTITEGKPKLVAFEPVDTGLDQRVLEGLAKSLAGRSDHPVSKAIAEGLSTADQEVGEFQALQGVECKVLSAIIPTRWPTTAGSRSVGNVRLNSKPASQFMRRQVARSHSSLTANV